MLSHSQPSSRDFFMDQNEKIYAHAFTNVTRLGPQRLRRLQKHFGNFQAAWSCPDAGEFERAGLDQKTREQVTSFRKRTNPEKLFWDLAHRRCTFDAVGSALSTRFLMAANCGRPSKPQGGVQGSMRVPPQELLIRPTGTLSS